MKIGRFRFINFIDSFRSTWLKTLICPSRLYQVIKVLLQRLCKLDSDLLSGVSKIEEEHLKTQEKAYCTAQPHY